MTVELSDQPIGSDRAPLALEYAASPQPEYRPRRVWLLVASLPVLAVPFLNFTYTVSPLDAVQSRGEFWPVALLGGEYFVGPIILAWRAGLLFFDSPRKAMARAVSAFTFIAWLPFIYSCVMVANDSVSHW